MEKQKIQQTPKVASQKREIRNYCQSAMVSDFFCFSVICHDVPRFVVSGVPLEHRKITARISFCNRDAKTKKRKDIYYEKHYLYRT